MAKIQKLEDISILRSVSIIIVVAFHVYGIMYDGNYLSIRKNKHASWISCCFPLYFL